MLKIGSSVTTPQVPVQALVPQFTSVNLQASDNEQITEQVPVLEQSMSSSSQAWVAEQVTLQSRPGGQAMVACLHACWALHTTLQ